MTDGLLIYGEKLRISSYIRKHFLLYDFAPDPIWMSLYMRKVLFSFLSVYIFLGFTWKNSIVDLVWDGDDGAALRRLLCCEDHDPVAGGEGGDGGRVAAQHGGRLRAEDAQVEVRPRLVGQVVVRPRGADQGRHLLHELYLRLQGLVP